MKLTEQSFKWFLRAVPATLLSTFLWQGAYAEEGLTATINALSMPGAASLTVNGLNSAGQVTGSWSDAGGVQRAFLSVNGVLFDLGSLGGNTAAALALNNSGQVAGCSSLPGETEFHGFMSGGETMFDLGTLGLAPSSALGINDAGQVTGYSYVAWGSLEQHAFLFSNDRMLDLGTLGGTYSAGFAINKPGQIIGECTIEFDAEVHAFLFSNGTMLDLGTLGGAFSSPNALNNLGHVTGGAKTTNKDTHAFLFNGSKMIDLGTLGGTYSEGYAINDLGWVAGDSSLADEQAYHGFVYDGVKLQDLGTLGGNGSSVWAINDRGQIVGQATDADQRWRAFLWQDGKMIDLNTLLPADSGWDLQAAYFINNSSQVVGVGNYRGQPGWFFLALSSRQNASPVANAGPDLVLECAGDKTPVHLDASASTDPDGDPLTFEWRLGDTVLGTSPSLDLAASFGAYMATLRVTDSRGAFAEDTVSIQVVDTTPPVMNCPAAVTVSVGAGCQVAIPDLVANLVAVDACTPAGSLVKSQVPPAGSLVSQGSFVVAITVADSAGNLATCSVPITVMDVTAPVISSVTANPETLTPLNHQMAPVVVTVVASDNCDPMPTCRIVAVTSSQPGVGTDGNTSPDWKITGPLTVELRAESTAKDTPRIYTITVACADAAGNTTTSTVTVRTQKNKKADVLESTRKTPTKGSTKPGIKPGKVK